MVVKLENARKATCFTKKGSVELPIVVVNMKDYIFADAITKALANGKSDYTVERVYTPDEVMQYSKLASVVILETTEFSPQYSFEARKSLQAKLKAANPDCKVVLLVDENSEAKLADRIVKAKRCGEIDGFLFGTVSASFLNATIQSL